MPRRRALATLAGAALVVGARRAGAQADGEPRPDSAAPAEVRAFLPKARLQGEGRLRYFGLHVYDARLWVDASYPSEAPAREAYAQHPLALELRYARQLPGARIAARSIEEMERRAPLPREQHDAWLRFMLDSFPDVDDGDRLTGLQQPGVSARFVFNGEPRGELRDAAFTQRFFGIWLAPQTSQPALRLALLGGGR
jgi:hypothetical protein